jgi:hypothetical protein
VGRSLGKQDVRRLQVTMDDVQPVYVADRTSQALDQNGSLGRSQRLALQTLLQAAAGAVLHGEERAAVVFTDLMELDDEGVS